MLPRAGFSLIELIVVLAVVSLLAVLSISTYGTISVHHDVNSSVTMLRSNIEAAKHRAVAGVNDSNWGIKLLADRMVIFRGVSYAARVTASDITTYWPQGVTFTGTDEIVFTKLTGSPSTTTAWQLTKKNFSTNLTLNATGTLQ
ncbi:MAG: prepilin-type N-terminal cleavage/methylation domain-containing protein [Patescibacteria group bacterium]|jgi:prepilin-type N-terminal cleavage/methylation domain-containing protein